MVKQNSLKSFKRECRLTKFLEEFFEGKHLLLRLDTLLAMEERLANEMVQLLGSSKKAQNSCKKFYDDFEFGTIFVFDTADRLKIPRSVSSKCKSIQQYSIE